MCVSVCVCVCTCRYLSATLSHEPPTFIYRVSLQVEKLLPNLGNPPIGAICALTGFGVENLMHEVAIAHTRWRRRIPTALLNSWLRRVERVRYTTTTTTTATLSSLLPCSTFSVH